MVGMILSAKDTVLTCYLQTALQSGIPLGSTEIPGLWSVLGSGYTCGCPLREDFILMSPVVGTFLPLPSPFCPRYCLRGEVFHVFSVTFTDVPFCSV